MSSKHFLLKMCSQAMPSTLLLLSGRWVCWMVSGVPPALKLHGTQSQGSPNLLALEKSALQRLVTTRGFVAYHSYLPTCPLYPQFPLHLFPPAGSTPGLLDVHPSSCMFLCEMHIAGLHVGIFNVFKGTSIPAVLQSTCIAVGAAGALLPTAAPSLVAAIRSLCLSFALWKLAL